MQLILQNGQPGRGFRGSQRGVCSRRWNRLTPRDVCEELASCPLFLLGRQSRATQPDRGGNDDENSSVGADDTCEH